VKGLRRNSSLAGGARKVLRVRLAEFDSHREAADRPEATEELHDLRIATKRLRYTLELFRPVFGDEGFRRLAEVKAIQERLGVLHYCDVRIALVDDELAATDLDPETRTGLEVMLAAERAERESAYRSFRACWDEVGRTGLREALAALGMKPGKESR